MNDSPGAGGPGRDDTGPHDDPHDHDVDARFAELVAQLESMPASDHSPPPPEEAHEVRPAPQPPDPSPPDPSPPAQPLPLPQTPEPAQPGSGITLPPQNWRSWAEPEVEEHYVPPDPPPLPAGDLHFWGIVVGLLGGPLLLLLAQLVPALRDPMWTWLGVLLGVGGVVLLVLRLPRNREDDPTGGARV